MKKWLLVFVVLLFPLNAGAQWKIVANRVFPTNVSRVAHYAMTYRAGNLWLAADNFYMSTDLGNTWTRQSVAPWHGVPLDVQFFDRAHGAVAGYGGVFLTSDEGVTWRLALSGAYTSVCFGDSFSTLAAAAFVTTDGGFTWIRSSNPHSWLSVFHLHNGTFLALGDGNIYQTSDLGNTWTASNGGVPFDSYGFSVDSCDQNLLFLPNENWIFRTGNISQLLRSSDRGNSWQSTLTGTIPFLCGSVALSSNAEYIQTITDGVYRSTDRGLNWKSIGGPTNQWDTRLIAAVNDNVIIAADSEGNIWQTTNSGGDPLVIAPSATFSASNVSNDTIGATVYVPIFSKPKLVGSDLGFSLHFNDSVLVYQGTYLATGSKVDQTIMRGRGLAKVHFDQSALQNEDTLLGYAAFTIFPRYDSCSTVFFDSISVSSASITACASVSQSFTATICSKVGCGTHTLSDFLRTGKLPILSIIPNPATRLTILHSDTDLGSVEVQVYDMLGVLRATESKVLSSHHSIDFNAASWPAGSYSIRVLLADLARRCGCCMCGRYEV